MKKSLLKKGLWVVLFLGVLIGSIWGCKYYEDQQRKKQDAYFTKDKLTVSEMNVMVYGYRVKSNPRWPWERDEEDWPDYSHYKIEPTENTEKVVKVMQYSLANEPDIYDSKAVEQYKKYGFSKENPITVDWIIKNPKKAVKLMQLTGGLFHSLGDWVNSTYEKITGETEYMSENTEDATSNEVESTE